MKLSKPVRIIVVAIVGLMTIVGLSGLIFIVPSNSPQTQQQPKENKTKNILTKSTMNKVNLVTSDGVKIAGNFYQPAGEVKGFVLYLHMMPATKESYNEIATRLQRVGYAGLSIDLRGHGESQGGTKGYLTYTTSEQQASIKDVRSAIEFLKKHGATDSDISIIGASIGANLAIEYAAQNNSIERIVALSPGLDYYGIKAGELVKKFSQNQSLLIAGSKDDTNVPDDYKQIQDIKTDYPNKNTIQVKIYDKGGHGTDIMKNNQELEDNIVAFIVG